MEDKEADQFFDRAARLSEHYAQVFVIVKSESGRIFWKSGDSLWARGAVASYLDKTSEYDRSQARSEMEDNG